MGVGGRGHNAAKIETLYIPTVDTHFPLVILSCWALETKLDFI